MFESGGLDKPRRTVRGGAGGGGRTLLRPPETSMLSSAATYTGSRLSRSNEAIVMRHARNDSYDATSPEIGGLDLT